MSGRRRRSLTGNEEDKAAHRPSETGVDKWGDRNDYVPTEQEKAAVATARRRLREAPCLPSVKAAKQPSGMSKLSYDHPHQTYAMARTIEAIGCGDPVLTDGLVHQLANITTRDGEVCEYDLNFALGIVKAIAPKDALESLLATQAAATHLQMLKAANLLNAAEMLPQADAAALTMAKLGRLFVMQTDALKRLRSPMGEQVIKVVHQHVTVNEGGQAIVGDVHGGGGGHGKIGRQPHAPLDGDAAVPAVLREVKADTRALPKPSSARLDGVPASRSAGRCANGSGKRRVQTRLTN